MRKTPTKNRSFEKGHRHLGVLLALIVLALGLAACGSDDPDDTATAADTPEATTTPAETEADAPAADAPETIRIGYQLIPNGDLIVKNQGWLEEAFPDSQIQWVKFDSGGDVNTAIAAGSLDFGLAGSSPVTNGLSNDIPYRVPWIHDIIGTAESLVATSDSGVTDLAGLVGKKVAVPFSSTTHYSLLEALQREDINPDEVEIIDLEPPDILAAWTRGDIDATYVWSPTLDELIDDGGEVLITSEDLAQEGVVTADLAVVTNEFAEAYPDAVQTWVNLQDQAVALYRDDPDAAAAAIAAELNIEPEQALAQTEGLTFLSAEEQSAPEFLGTVDAPGQLATYLHSASEFLAALGQLPEAPELSVFEAGLAPQWVNAVQGG